MANPKPASPHLRPRTRRGPVLAASLIALAAAGGLAFLGARSAADFIQAHSARDVTQALQGGGFGWAQVATDGLQVRLTGTAPDEIQRFRAKSRAETVVEQGRVIDDMQVAARAALGTPDFKVELLRNGDGISIVGLVPATLDRASMVAGLRRQNGTQNIADLVETADYPVPKGWDAAFAYGLKAAQLAKRAKISVAPGRVGVRAITDNPAEKRALEQALDRARPADVALTADITAPRPVVTPFTLRFVKDAAGARFDACAADTDDARNRILDAGAQAGVPGSPQCTLALGAPSGAWADAAVAGLRAVQALGAGSVTLADTDVALFAPADVETAAFDEAAGRLEGALPAGFTLKAEHEKRPEIAPGAAEFSASVHAGTVMLRGHITDQRMRDAVESLARSRFAHVDSALRADGLVPEGWTLRAIAALEALGGLDRGTVKVTPDLITLSGVSGSQTASDAAAARLSHRLGAGARYELAIRYDRQLDPLLGLPSGMECVDGLNAAMKESEIGFEPSKSVIAGDPEPTLQRLAGIMADCGDYRIELGGHTDSQGSEGFNAELSRARAQAVLEALARHGIDTAHMTVRGYGETQPITENDTDAGREANRRIEFTLLSDMPVVTEKPQPAQKVTGVTDSAEMAAARTAQAATRAATGALAPALGVTAEASPRTQAPVLTAATIPAAQAIGGTLSLAIIDALTVPALEAAFPDNGEALPVPAPGADGGMPVTDLPDLVPLGPPVMPGAQP